MVVSQGLKSVTQTLGCVISLFIISPQVSQTLWNIFIVTHLTIYSVPGNFGGANFWQNMNYSIPILYVSDDSIGGCDCTSNDWYRYCTGRNTEGLVTRSTETS